MCPNNFDTNPDITAFRSWLSGLILSIFPHFHENIFLTLPFPETESSARLIRRHWNFSIVGMWPGKKSPGILLRVVHPLCITAVRRDRVYWFGAGDAGRPVAPTDTASPRTPPPCCSLHFTLHLRAPMLLTKEANCCQADEELEKVVLMFRRTSRWTSSGLRWKVGHSEPYYTVLMEHGYKGKRDVLDIIRASDPMPFAL